MSSNDGVSRRRALQAIGAAGLATVAGCMGDDPSDNGGGNGDVTRAAWVTDTPTDDLGWSWAHNQGQEAVADEFDWVETTVQEDVDPADAYQTMSELVNQEYDVIFGCAFDYGDTMEELSEDNPDVAFEHATGFEYGGNMGLYFGRQYQIRYLLGVAAGMLDDVDVIGYVGAHPVPEVIRGINAMALGARSVDEDVTVEVRFTNTWYDPPQESDAAQSLIDEGVDLMAQHQDSPAALQAAADNDIWATGYQAPMGQHAEENYLTSAIWDWGEFYVPVVEEVHEGNWEAEFNWMDIDSGVVTYDEFGSEVPSDIVDEVESVEQEIRNGELEVWADTQFEDDDDWELYSGMEEFVDGVKGSL